MKTCGLLCACLGDQVNHSDFLSINSMIGFEVLSQVRPNDVISSEFGWPA